jgi:hypothetical protein
MRSRRISIVIIMVLVGILVHAQPRLKKPEIFLGVHGGAMMSSMLFSPSIAQVDLLAGPLSGNGGLLFRYAEHKVCAVQVECNYMQRGWSEKWSMPTGMVQYTRRLHYIEVPLLMHLYFGKKQTKGFFNLGPQIGYYFREETEIKGENPSAWNGVQHKPIDNPFDWGLAAGVGMYYHSKKAGVFQLEARCNFSLGGAFKTGQMQTFMMANPVGVSVNLAYLWNFKKKQ